MNRAQLVAFFLFLSWLSHAQTLFQTDIVDDYRDSAAALNVITLEQAVGSGFSGSSSVVFSGEKLRIIWLPTITYASQNSNIPYGDRDGFLWQGRGLSGSLTSGAFVSGRWWSATLAPEFGWSQNRAFEMGPSSDPSNPYATFPSRIDLPQRMGNDPWSSIGWGQSELRVNYGPLTVGLGTQSFSFGPAVVNPLLFSGNSAGFPHFDVGVQPYSTSVGLIEARAFWGILSESVAYDDDPSNDDTLLSALALSYRPSFVPILTFGAYRTVATNRQDATTRFAWQVFDPRPRGGNRESGDPVYGTDAVDQMVALSVELALRDAGFRGYIEWAREDFASNLTSFIQIPYHSAAWTAGAEQVLFQNGHGELTGLIEFTRNWQSRNYFLDRQYSSSFFYGHHIVRHGHTHQGQLLGAPAGPGTEGGTLRFSWNSDFYRFDVNFERYAVNSDYVYANPDTLDRSNLDTETAASLAFTYDFGTVSIGVDGTFVNRTGFNYESGAVQNSFRFGTTIEYRP